MFEFILSFFLKCKEYQEEKLLQKEILNMKKKKCLHFKKLS